MMYLF